MITTILSDFSRVVLLPKDPTYIGTLNGLNKELLEKNKDYSFFDYFQFNNELLDLYKGLSKKYSVNIFTTGTIQNRAEVRKIIDSIFQNIFAAKDFNINKKTPEAYTFIAEKLGKVTSEVLFIDDQIANIEAAQKAGMKVMLYNSVNDILRKVEGELAK